MSDDSPEMQLLSGLMEEDFNFKYPDLPDKYLSDIDAILEGLYSRVMQSLETPAINFTSLSWGLTPDADATRKLMLHDQSNYIIIAWHVTVVMQLANPRHPRPVKFSRY